MREKLQSRCGRHCLKLGDDGGSCNAIVYNRESKVSFYKNAKLPLNHNFTTSQISLFWGQTRITKKTWIKVCFMGEGRLVAGSPTVDTGLRVAWSRFSNVEQAITFKITILSPNKTGFVGAKWQKNQSSQLNLHQPRVQIQCLVCCGQEDAKWNVHLLWFISQVLDDSL